MKDNFIHVCFIIDESGSMYSSAQDVIKGFKSVIDEQTANNKGTCAVSLYKFADNVTEVYRGKDINEVKPLVEATSNLTTSTVSITKFANQLGIDLTNIDDIKIDDITELEDKIKQFTQEAYAPNGSTAMFDGIGTAINNIGQWLNNMNEEDRPSKNLIVIMTDGMENASIEYTASKVKAMIKEQEEKYNWTFVYMGTDICTSEYADNIGIKHKMYTTRSDYATNYSFTNDVISSFRCADANVSAAVFNDCLDKSIDMANDIYNKKTGLNLK